MPNILIFFEFLFDQSLLVIELLFQEVYTQDRN
jgi:hypothetical protein